MKRYIKYIRRNITKLNLLMAIFMMVLLLGGCFGKNIVYVNGERVDLSKTKNEVVNINSPSYVPVEEGYDWSGIVIVVVGALIVLHPKTLWLMKRSILVPTPEPDSYVIHRICGIVIVIVGFIIFIS